MVRSFLAAYKPKTLLFTSAILVFFLSALLIVYDYWRFTHRPFHTHGSAFEYTVHKGMSLRAIAADLQSKHLISSSMQRFLVRKGRPYASELKAGDYQFAAGLSLSAFLQQLRQGGVIQHKVTFVEGWTLRQVLAALATNSYLTHELTDVTPRLLAKRLRLKHPHPEGLFFPDTYQFSGQSSDIDILQRAYDLMQERLQTAWEQRAPDLPYTTPYQALIVASLVEKESALPSERAIIANIIIKRWQKGMRLQIDPTVIYGLGDAYTGQLRYRDLKHESPYNTYRYKGLPPTPIALPSLAAITAALHPQETPYWYFVAKSGGAHYFSSTLAEQKQAVQRYRALKKAAAYFADPRRLYYSGLIIHCLL